jgi:hypothetical protein
MSYYTQRGPVYGILQREISYHEDRQYEPVHFSHEPRSYDKFTANERAYPSTEPSHFEDEGGFGQSDVYSERNYVEASYSQPQYRPAYDTITDETGIYQVGQFKKDSKRDTAQKYNLPDKNKRKEEARAAKAKQNSNSSPEEQPGPPETILQKDQTPSAPNTQRSLARYGRTPMNQIEQYRRDNATGFCYPKTERKATEPLSFQPGQLLSRGTSFNQQPRYGEDPNDYLREENLGLSRSLGGSRQTPLQYQSCCYDCGKLFENDAR